ncbi:MAG: hypothetical protein EPN82_15170 [Bacteroidetes bacterium]|nr:MAG: hypothetical protein EPN82_15170 [Bacteroidota bacterium]
MQKYLLNINLFIILLLIINNYSILSQNKITVLTLDNPAPGYLLMDTFEDGYLSITDNSGFAVINDKLKNFQKGDVLYIQKNDLLTFYTNLKFYAIDNGLNLIDSFVIKNSLMIDPHDFKLTNDGNAFFLGNVYDTVDLSEIVPGGKPNAVLRSSVIQEQDENKNVIWEWNTLDHYKVTDATSSVDLTQQNVSWVHTNSIEIDYDGNVLISSRDLDEITKINRQTGAIIWRLGGKECKNNQFTFLNDTIDGFWGFSHQHSIHLLPNGNLLLFDNGNLKPIQYSRAVEYEIDEVNKTVKKVWEYRCSPDIYSITQGSVQRLPNGNTIIGWGANTQQITFTEVMPDGSKAMEAKNFSSYQVMRYPIIMASKLIMVQNAGIYNFSDTSNKTGVLLDIYGLTDSGYVSVERHDYVPHNIAYDGLAPVKTYGHRWVLNNKGISQLTAKIIFKLSEIVSTDSLKNYKIYWRKQEGSGKFSLLETTYNQSQSTLEANIISFGEFILGVPLDSQTSLLISPADSSTKNPIILYLLWHKFNGADSYKLQVSTDINFNVNLVDTGLTADTTLALTGLENNKIYYWRLKSVTNGNETNWSNPWSFTTLLKTPELIKPANRETEFQVKGIFEWNSVPGADKYIINISLDPDFDSIVVNKSDVTITRFSPLTPLDFNKYYYWRVKPLNSNNEGSWSNINIFMTEINQVLNIPILQSPANDTTDIPLFGFLYWYQVKNAMSYKIELSIDSNFIVKKISQIGINSTNMYYSDLNYSTVYYWHVAASNQFDTSSWSVTWKFRTQNYGSVVSDNENNFIIYNESNNKLFINIENLNNNTELIIADITGRITLRRILTDYKTIIDCYNLERGIYFYTIIQIDSIVKGKLLIY